MQLEVSFSKESQLNGFDVWLLNRIKKMLKSQVDPRRLQLVSKYLEEEESIPKISSKLDATKIFIQGIDSLFVVSLDDKFIIQLNKNQFTPGLDRIKLHSIIRLITFGNKSVPPYPLIVTVFQDVEKNIQHYVKIFQEETI